MQVHPLFLFRKKPIASFRRKAAFRLVRIRLNQNAESILLMIFHNARKNKVLIFVLIHVHGASPQPANQHPAVQPRAKLRDILLVSFIRHIHRAGVGVNQAKCFRRLSECAGSFAV